VAPHEALASLDEPWQPVVQLGASDLGGQDLIQKAMKAALAMVVILWAVITFTPSGEGAGEGAAPGAALAPLLFGIMALRAEARQFVLRHRRGVMISGAVIIGASLVFLFGSVS